MASFVNPDVATFKAAFFRDFPYGSSIQNVQDADVQTGINDAAAFINSNLFNSQSLYTTCFLNLAAHFMVMNMRASGAQNQGLAGQWTWVQSGKSVGPVSESFSIPERVMGNPEYAALSKTYYGAKALMFMLPLLSAACFTVSGFTKP